MCVASWVRRNGMHVRPRRADSAGAVLKRRALPAAKDDPVVSMTSSIRSKPSPGTRSSLSTKVRYSPSRAASRCCGPARARRSPARRAEIASPRRRTRSAIARLPSGDPSSTRMTSKSRHAVCRRIGLEAGLDVVLDAVERHDDAEARVTRPPPARDQTMSQRQRSAPWAHRCGRCAPRRGRRGPAPGRRPVGWSARWPRCHDVAGPDVLDDEERPAEPQPLLLGLAGRDLGLAERLPGGARLGDEQGQLVRLEREGGVDAALLAGDRHVLLDDRGAERDGRDGRADAHGVVGEADRHLERAARAGGGRAGWTGAGPPGSWWWPTGR